MLKDPSEAVKMSEYTQTESRYLIFGIKNSKFAVPIDTVKSLISTDSDIQLTSPPDKPINVKFLINLSGDFFPVIELPDLIDDSNAEENIIIVFEQNGKTLGLLAHNAQITTVEANSITVDRFTGTKAFMYKDVPHMLIDIPKLYEFADA